MNKLEFWGTMWSGFCIGLGLGLIHSGHSATLIKKHAVEAGAAYYSADSEGKTQFHWIKNN